MNLLDWVDGELLSSVRNKIRTMLSDLNKEANYLSATAPASPVGCQVWTDNVNGIVYQRNSTNTAWLPVRRVNGPTILTLTAAYTATVADYGSHLIFTSGSSVTALSLPAVSTVADGFWIDVSNNTVYDLLVDGYGTETVDGFLGIRLPPKGGSVRVVKKGSAWYSLGRAMLPRTIAGVKGAGYTGAANATAANKATGTYIDLPPGRWIVYLSCLLTGTVGAGSYSWVRFYLSDTSTGGNTPDSEGANLAAGVKVYPAPYDTAKQEIVVNNQGTTTKRYYVVLGAADPWDSATNTFSTIWGSSWSENNIYAMKLQDG